MVYYYNICILYIRVHFSIDLVNFFFKIYNTRFTVHYTVGTRYNTVTKNIRYSHLLQTKQKSYLSKENVCLVDAKERKSI